MGFDSIKGQQKALFILARSMADSRLHHAYRFEGPQGTGKTMTAMAMAATLNCLSPVEKTFSAAHDGRERRTTIREFCGGCRSCRKIPVGGSLDSLDHPDVYLLQPQGQSRLIKIEQIREIQSIAAYAPVEGKARVFVIREADKVTEAASNAFLKLLEEPPRDTYFFLTTSRPHKLLQTIRSRTTVVRFSPLSSEDVKAILLEAAPGSDEKALALAASMSGGSVSRALDGLEGEGSAAEALKFVSNFDNNLLLAPEKLMSMLGSSSPSKQTIEDVLHLLGIYYRDVAWMRATGDRKGIMLGPMEDRVTERARTMSPRAAAFICWRVSEGLRMMEQNVNPRMIVEKIIFDLRGMPDL
jgi:DNA polymerase-3 subunit delta'